MGTVQTGPRPYAHLSWPALVPLGLFCATFAVYGVTGAFSLLTTWDDTGYLLLNETIKGVSFAHVREAFSQYYAGNYAPLHILSYLLDHALWGLSPAGYHLENVLLHALNGILFYHLLRRLDCTQWQATAAAWIFLFHPVQAETVAWVSQRKNLLAMLFFLTTLLSYRTYATRETGRTLPYLLALCSSAAAMLSKSVTVILPAILLFFDYTYLATTSRQPTRKRLLDKLPFVLLAAVFAGMAFVSQSEEAGGGRTGYPGGSPLATFYTMVPVLVSYLRDCIWPSGLSPFYMTTIRLQPDSAFFAALAVLIPIAAAGVWLYRHHRPLFFWYGLFFVALLPVLQIIPLVTLKHDRYLYFPLLGCAVLAVTFGHKVLTACSRRCRPLLLALIAAVLLLLPPLAYQQTLFWRNDLTLWNRAIAVDPENRLGWRLLAMAYTTAGDAPNAIKALRRVQELRQKYGPMHGHDDL